MSGTGDEREASVRGDQIKDRTQPLPARRAKKRVEIENFDGMKFITRML